jgi:predicted transcriptional regulator
MRYRTREEIFASILTAAGSGRQMTLTKLGFYCYLPHSSAIESTATLVEKGLLEFDRLNKVFRTTDKGFMFLELHEEMSEIFKVEKELVRHSVLT